MTTIRILASLRSPWSALRSASTLPADIHCIRFGRDRVPARQTSGRSEVAAHVHRCLVSSSRHRAGPASPPRNQGVTAADVSSRIDLEGSGGPVMFGNEDLRKLSKIEQALQEGGRRSGDRPSSIDRRNIRWMSFSHATLVMAVLLVLSGCPARLCLMRGAELHARGSTRCSWPWQRSESLTPVDAHRSDNSSGSRSTAALNGLVS
jgi:hypothetical protein